MRKPMTEEDCALLRRMWADGASQGRIAAKLGRPVGTIAGYIQRHGLRGDRAAVPGQKKRDPLAGLSARTQAIVRFLAMGWSNAAVADHLDELPARVRNVAYVHRDRISRHRNELLRDEAELAQLCRAGA